MMLSILLFLPLFFSAALLFVPSSKPKALWAGAIGGSVLVTITSIQIVMDLDINQAGYQMVERIPWITHLGVEYHLGLDGLSLWLVLLTTILCPLILFASTSSIDKKVKGFVVSFLFLEWAMLGAFLSLNMVLFYVFWEVMLIPMFFMIGIWGGAERIYATIKFFLFTLIGSLLMLAAVIYLYTLSQDQNPMGASFYFNDLYNLSIDPTVQKILFGAFFLAFAVKVPLFPVHTWLPDAHVQAPTPGSVLLAGVLLKMGTYGFIRLGMPLFPEASTYFTLPIIALSVIGILYGALVALVQTDIKKLVAYSSVSHMGYIMLGIYTYTLQGMQGSLIQMINHGISTGALFLLVGFIYERRHTRALSEFGGLAQQMPKFAVVFIIVMLSSIALPLTNGFIGEFNILMASFNYAKNMAEVTGNGSYFLVPFGAGLGVILGAVYMLYLTQKMFFGPLDNPENKNLPDLSKRELAIITPFIFAIFYLGLYPNGFFRASEASLKQIIEISTLEVTK